MMVGGWWLVILAAFIWTKFKISTDAPPPARGSSGRWTQIVCNASKIKRHRFATLKPCEYTETLTQVGKEIPVANTFPPRL